MDFSTKKTTTLSQRIRENDVFFLFKIEKMKITCKYSHLYIGTIRSGPCPLDTFPFGVHHGFSFLPEDFFNCYDQNHPSIHKHTSIQTLLTSTH